MDRKTHRSGGTVTASAESSTPRLLLPDDVVPDEATLWTITLQELVRVAELQDTNATLTETLEKQPEGRSQPLTLIQEAAEKALEERDAILRSLEGINLILAMRDGDSNNDDSPEGKRKKRKIEAEGLVSNSKKMRRYSSAESGGIIPVGQQVAARTPKDKNNKAEEWILARVLSYSAEKNKYLVEDDEADDYGKKMTYSLHARSVIMIMDDQESVPEFPAGHTVLALYPSTTCFYKAIVLQPPSKNKDYATLLYRIKFDDDEGNERTAPPRMVLDMPKHK